MKFVTHCVKDTEAIAQKLAKKLKGNEIVAFYGDLGVGKTAFIRGMVDYFGIKNLVSSPTFSLVNEYQTNKFKIYHFDMYRIKSSEDLESTGYFDYINRGVFLIEWSENIENDIPDDAIEISIEKGNSETLRIIEIKGVDFDENIGC